MTPQEMGHLRDIASTTSDSATLVEIGSYLGASASAIASGMPTSSKLVCVDTWNNDAMSEGSRDTFGEFRRNTSEFDRNIETKRGTSDTISSTFQGDISFLFVDADHSWEGVSRDISAWRRHLTRDAWVLLHDAGWAEGVIRASRLISTNWNISETQHLPNLHCFLLRSKPSIISEFEC